MKLTLIDYLLYFAAIATLVLIGIGGAVLFGMFAFMLTYALAIGCLPLAVLSLVLLPFSWGAFLVVWDERKDLYL